MEDLTKVETLLESKAASPPHLVVIMKHNELELCYVLGDQVQINCQSGVLDGLVVLLGTYYVCDLDYPDIFSQALGILQQHVLGDVYTGKKGTNFILFTKSLSKELEVG